jgi:hypothetical protein
LLRIEKHGAKQRQGRRGQGRRSETKKRARRDERLDARGERGEDGRATECGRAHQQQAASPDPVTEHAHGDQGAGQYEPVDVDDPQQLGTGGFAAPR